MASRRETRRVPVREGYDIWANTYDTTVNPVVAVDAKYASSLLQPRKGERILDAGCGTGRNLSAMKAAGARAVGLDFSLNMLRVARAKLAAADLVQGDLQQELPVRPASFDAVLCALIGEHLPDLRFTLRQLHRTLAAGGRMVFTVYHPDLAAAGKEANFELDEAEYRLGAVRYTLSDYLGMTEDAGFTSLRYFEYFGDAETGLNGSKAILALEAVKPN